MTRRYAVCRQRRRERLPGVAELRRAGQVAGPPVRTAIAGHHLPDAAEHRPFSDGERQIQAFYLVECDGMDAALEWANRLPTYGYVEVRELIQD